MQAPEAYVCPATVRSHLHKAVHFHHPVSAAISLLHVPSHALYSQTPLPFIPSFFSSLKYGFGSPVPLPFCNPNQSHGSFPVCPALTTVMEALLCAAQFSDVPRVTCPIKPLNSSGFAASNSRKGVSVPALLSVMGVGGAGGMPNTTVGLTA